MKKPSKQQGRIISALMMGGKLLRAPPRIGDRNRAKRYFLNGHPANRKTVESCIAAGWVRVIPREKADNLLSNRCEETGEGVRALA